MHLGLGNSQKAKRFRKFVTRSSTKFDGTDDFIVSDVNQTLATQTFSFWLKNSDTSERQTIFTHGLHYIGAFHINWDLSEDHGPIIYFDSGSYKIFSDAACPQQDDGNWHHYLVAVDSTAVENSRLWIDNEEITSVVSTNTGAAAAFNSGIRFGKSADQTWYYGGSIDEFAIFTGLQTDKDFIRELYNNGQPTKLKTNSNLAHWFRMGEGKLGPKSDGDSNILFQGLPTTFGSELVTNGDFSSSSGWTLDTNASVSGGKLVLASSTGLSYQGIDLDDGHAYEVSFEVSNYSSGNVKAYLNGTNGTVRSANGTYTEVIIAGSSNTLAGINPSGTMDIDNFSIKKLTNVGRISGPAVQADGGTELVTNGDLSNGTTSWENPSGGAMTSSVVSGKLRLTSSSAYKYVFQSFTTRIGGVYSFTVDVTKGTSPNYDAYLGTGQNGATLFNSGSLGFADSQGDTRTITGTFTATSTTTFLNLRSRNQDSLTDAFTDFDNISVKEVTESVPKKVQNLPSAGSAKSLSFDGSDDVVEVSSLTTLSGASKFTLSGWFNKADAGHPLTISYTQNGSNRTSINFANDSKVYLNVAAGGANYGEFALASTNWVHVAMVYDGSASGNAARLKGYLDGVEQTLTFNSTIPAAAHSQSAIFRIGKDQANGVFSQGGIDEVAVWDTALDGDAIKALYNAGQPTPVTTKTGAYDIYRDNLKAYYKMGDASDPAADGTSNLLFDQTNPGEVEMITNGDFSNGTTDWTAQAGGTVSVVNGKLRVTSSSSYRYAYQLMTTRVGGVYSVTLEGTKGTSPNYDAFVGTGTGAGNLVYLGNFGSSDSQGDTATMSGIFTATTTTSYLMLRSRNESSVADAFTDFDNVSVKEYNGNTGTITGATIQTEAPKAIYALPPVANTKSLNFDGTNDYLQTQVDATAQPNNESRYYSWWLKTTGGGQRIWDHGDTTKGAFQINNGNKPLLYMASTVFQYWVDNPAQDDGNWHHWTVKIKFNDLTGCELWIDGVKQEKDAAQNNGSMESYTTGLRIGRGGDSYFNGSIDEFSIHEDLDEEAIRALFNRGRPIDISSGHGAYDQSDKALHWWRMGDATSPAADGTNDIIFQGFEAEDSELITNGDYSDASVADTFNGSSQVNLSGWTSGGSTHTADAHFVITNGACQMDSDGTNVTISQGTTVVGMTYKYSLEITDYVTGGMTVAAGGVTVQANITSNGTYTGVFVATGTTAIDISRKFGAAAKMTIDNVSVKQVRGQYIGAEQLTNGDFSSSSNWTLTSSAEITGGVANWPDATNSYIYQNANINLAGIQAYKLEYDVVTTNGSTGLRLDGGSSAFANTLIPSDTVGKKTVYVVSNGSQAYLMFKNSASFVGSIDNVSLKPVGGAAVMTNMTTSDIQTDTPY